MKHSIKREQSHARMSFAEYENQRSLAEGESNVRATLKHMKLSFHLILTLAVMLTMAQTAWAQEAAVYDLVTEKPTVDGGQSTNLGSNYNYYRLVDGDTYTVYGISNANPWVEFHYSRAFVPKKYILWTGDIYSFQYNPATWTIKAKLNKTDEWTTLATVDNSNRDQLPENDHVSKEFSIESNTKAYKYFRFEATRRYNGTFQLGELQFKEATNLVTMTWNMYSGGSVNRTESGKSADFTNSEGNVMRYSWTADNPLRNIWKNDGCLFEKVIRDGLSVSFPYLTGTVTKVEINQVYFEDPGMNLSISKGTANGKLKTGNNSEYYASSVSGDYKNITFSGEIDVDATNYLRFTFSRNGINDDNSQMFCFGGSKPAIKVTMEKAKKADLGHTFTTSSIIASGSTLTATCTSTDADHVALYSASHHFTLTLNAADGMADPGVPVTASLTPAVGDFNEDTQLGATCTVEYAPQGTSQSSNSWTTSAPYVAGNYTARATVRINSTDYVLTTNFSVIEGHYITNNNSQQLSVNKTGAMAGENITVTFTPKMGESLTTLTVTGDNTSLSIGSGITDKGDNTYMFAMPNEDVTLGATFTFPMDENNFDQDGDAYTIKNADGWNYFCQRMQYDANLDGFNGKTVELAANITVTTMAGTVRSFKGTFDGKGKTLNFNHTADDVFTAPFQNTNGATIKNLHVAGLIQAGNNKYCGGLVGSASGNLTIRDCRVSTQISSTISDNAGIGGIVGYVHYTNHLVDCNITGCVFDGLIYNPNSAGQTYGCGGFVGTMSQYAYVDLTDCLFIHGQYDNNGGKCELNWGDYNIENSTFFHRSNNQGEGTLTNCYYVDTHGRKQGAPAVESATAPTNFAHLGTPTDHCFMKTYGRLMLFNEKYYTPTYGDLVETYDYSGVKSYNIEYDDKPLGIPDITSQLSTSLLRYKRTFTTGKPVTVMLPFNFTKSDFKKGGSSDGLTGHFYEFKGIRLDENVSNKWVAVMGEPENPETTTMKANTPYLYVPGENTNYWYIENYSGIPIFTEGYEGGNKVTPYDGTADFAWNKWDFKGTYQPRYWSDSENPEEIGKVYGFAGATKEVDEKPVVAGDFVRAKSGAKIRPTSCYLMWAGSEPSNARALTRGAAATEELPQRITVKLISASGETTAIGTLDTKTGEVTFDSKAWYTLDGVRLSGKPSTKGIYINNGKKIVIK